MASLTTQVVEVLRNRRPFGARSTSTSSWCVLGSSIDDAKGSTASEWKDQLQKNMLLLILHGLVRLFYHYFDYFTIVFSNEFVHKNIFDGYQLC